jgi:rRNA-processing protein FCF1
MCDGIPRVVLIDSNLLLLLLVGSTDRKQIQRFKRTKKFSPDDFDRLVLLLGRFRRIATTPNVLTEVSNLAGQLHGTFKAQVLAGLGLISQELDERYIETSRVSGEACFTRLGLTDAAISLAASEGTVVLTDDFPLTVELQRLGIPVQNYESIRAAGRKPFEG